MIILNVLRVNGNLVILLHVIALQFSFHFEFNSVNERMLFFFLVGARWDDVSLELLKFIEDLVLNIVEVQW